MSIVLLLLIALTAEANHHHRHHRGRHHHFLEHRSAFEDLELLRSRHHKHRHHNHRRHHEDTALTTMGVSFKEGGMSLKEGGLDLHDFGSEAAQGQDASSQPHPLVAVTLKGMGDAFQEVKEKENMAKSMRERMQARQQQEMAGMSRGVALRRLLVGSKASAKAQEEVLANLQGEGSRLQGESEEVRRKLDAVMEPRIARSERKLAKKRKALTKTEMEMRRLEGLRSKFKVSALQTLADRNSKRKILQEMNEAIKEAEKRERVAETQCQEARRKVSDTIEAYKFAQTRYESIQSRDSLRKEKVAQAEDSVEKTRAIYKVESERIDKALSISDAKLHTRIVFAQKQREKARHRFEVTTKRLQEWKAKQAQLASEVSKMKQEFDSMSKDASEQRRLLMKKAENMAGGHARSQSDWQANDWAWNGQGEFGSDPNTEEITLD